MGRRDFTSTLCKFAFGDRSEQQCLVSSWCNLQNDAANPSELNGQQYDSDLTILNRKLASLRML